MKNRDDKSDVYVDVFIKVGEQVVVKRLGKLLRNDRGAQLIDELKDVFGYRYRINFVDEAVKFFTTRFEEVFKEMVVKEIDNLL